MLLKTIMSSSAKDIHNAMMEALETDKSIKRKIKASVQFKVEDSNGGTETFSLHAKDGGSESNTGPVDLVVTLSLETLQQLLAKKNDSATGIHEAQDENQRKDIFGNEIKCSIKCNQKILESTTIETLIPIWWK